MERTKVSDLHDLIHSTVMKAVTLGTEYGAEAERKRIVELLNAADSACSGWAVGLIEVKDE
jgi:hypothetical protein